MPIPSALRSLLVAAVLFARLPAFAAPPLPPEPSSQGLGADGPDLSQHAAGRGLAAAILAAHRPRAPAAAATPRFSGPGSLTVQDIIIDSTPGAPFTIIRTFEDTRLIVEFLPSSPARLGVPPPDPHHPPPLRATGLRVPVRQQTENREQSPANPSAVAGRPRMNPEPRTKNQEQSPHAAPPFIAAVLAERIPPVADAPAALPARSDLTFASPVPGKPGCVYPPRTRRTPANIVDVTGQPPGTRVRDPVTHLVFWVP